MLFKILRTLLGLPVCSAIWPFWLFIVLLPTVFVLVPIWVVQGEWHHPRYGDDLPKVRTIIVAFTLPWQFIKRVWK